jgi:hypothetical protein
MATHHQILQGMVPVVMLVLLIAVGRVLGSDARA